MNKKCSLFIILIFFCFYGNSQNTYKPETQVGVKMGATISSVRFDPKVNQNLNIGFIGGLSFKHIEEKGLGVQIELNYLQAGWDEKLDSSKSYSRRLNSIQLPFMTHFNFGNNKSRVFINLGSYLSYLLSEGESIENISKEEEKEYYRKEIANKTEFGLCMGLGFTQYTSVGIFQIEGRGNIGFSDIFDNNNESSITASKNMIIEISLTYFISL